MSVKIKWCIYKKDIDAYSPYGDGMKLLIDTPDPLLKNISKTRPGVKWLQCPAVHKFCKNTFVIKSPCEFDLNVDFANSTVMVEGFDDEFMKEFINIKSDDAEGTNYLSIDLLAPYLIFMAEDADSVEIQTMAPFLHKTQIERFATYIPGSFNISKWIRPVSYTFEVSNKENVTLEFKEGTPLYYIKFLTKNDEDVELEYVEYNKDIRNVMRACVNGKNIKKNIPLERCYEYAKKLINTKNFTNIFKR